MAFKKIRDLDSFDENTPFNTGDYLAVSDASGNTTRKATVKEVVETYNVQRAEEQVTEGDSQPQLVTDLNGDLVSADPVTAANLDDFVQADSGLEIITTCATDAATGNQVCSKRLSIAKSSTSLQYYLFVCNSSNLNDSSESGANETIDLYWTRSGYNGLDPEDRVKVLVGKSTKYFFSNIYSAQAWAENNCPAGAKLDILVMGDITTPSGPSTSSRVGRVNIMDYNAWAYELMINGQPKPAGAIEGYKFTSGLTFRLGETIFNGRGNENQAGLDFNWYVCTEAHTSGATLDQAKFRQITPHNCHGAFSSFNGEMRFAVNKADQSVSIEPMYLTSGDLNRNFIFGKTPDFARGITYNGANFGGLNNHNRPIYNIVKPVSDIAKQSFASWSGHSSGHAFGIYHLVITNNLQVGTNGAHKHAGIHRIAGATSGYYSVNNVDYVCIGDSNVHQVQNFFDFIGNCAFRVFDSGRLATVSNPYGAANDKHGMAIYHEPGVPGGEIISFTSLFKVSENSTVSLGTEYWSHSQKAGTVRHSTTFFGTDTRAGMFVLLVGGTFQFGMSYKFPETHDVTFSSDGPINTHFFTGSETLATSDGKGPTTLDYSDTNANWDATSEAFPTVTANGFATILVPAGETHLPGRNFEIQQGAHPAHLLTNDGFVSWSAYSGGQVTDFYHDSSTLPASRKMTVNKDH